MEHHDFKSLHLNQPMLKNLATLGYSGMTPVQAHALPHILAGRDVIAKAKTGSGKTAAFGIGLLAALDKGLMQLQGLVLCPTRELADQVAKELRRLARFTDNIKILTLCGGVPFGPQLTSLESGVHIAVGTPGRLLDHLRRGSLDLSALRTLVLDEADRMLDMGFQDDITTLIAAVPPKRQTLLFSATYPDSINSMSSSIQNHPVDVMVDETHSDQAIEQLFFEVEHEERGSAVVRVLGHYRPESALIFCNTKAACHELAEELVTHGFAALAIHGDLEQRERDQVLIRFANHSATLLVATDVAARGLDIKELPMVINYELSRNAEVHTHRIGRTGRAGGSGVAVSLVAHREARLVKAIEEETGITVAYSGLEQLSQESTRPDQPVMTTLCIAGGRKNKLRAGDVVGALTGEGGMTAGEIGRIDVCDQCTYVAVLSKSSAMALSRLAGNRIKGRFFKVRKI